MLSHFRRIIKRTGHKNFLFRKVFPLHFIHSYQMRQKPLNHSKMEYLFVSLLVALSHLSFSRDWLSLFDSVLWLQEWAGHGLDTSHVMEPTVQESACLQNQTHYHERASEREKPKFRHLQVKAVGHKCTESSIHPLESHVQLSNHPQFVDFVQVCKFM